MIRPTTTAIFATLVTLTTLNPAWGQETEEADPLKGTHKLGDAAEILLLWTDGRGSGERFNILYDYLNLNNPDPNIQNDLVLMDSLSVSSLSGPEDDAALDVITGDFDGDDLDDYVAVWEGPERSIEMVIPEFDRTALRFTEPHFVTIADTGSMLNDPLHGRVLRLAKGDFDMDSESEFLLAYWGADRTLQIELWETDASHVPMKLSTFSDPDITYLGSDSKLSVERSTRWFDVNAGDFDGDGTDEIIAVGGRDLPCSDSFGCWQVFVRVYDVHPETFELVQRVDTTIFEKTDNSNKFMWRIAVEPGRYGPEFAEGAAIIFEQTNSNNVTQWYLTMSRIIMASDEEGNPLAPAMWGSAADTSHFAIGPDGTDEISSSQAIRGYALSVEAVDFERDGIDELVLFYRQLEIYEIRQDYTPNRVNSGLAISEPSDIARHALAVADLDADNDLVNESSRWLPELIVVENDDISDDGGNDGILTIKVISWDPDLGFNSRLVGEISNHRIDQSGTRPVVIAALDVGDNGIRVGRPKRHAKTEIVRPLVILNSPPTHFDVFENEIFDVNHCYGEEDCACRDDLARCFQAEYSTETEQSITMETELMTDWSIATTVEGGFEIPIVEVGVEASITATYGEGFRRKGSSSQTFTVRQSVQATRDDWIYAMIVNYDIWEYPLYSDGEQVGNIAVVIPKLKTRAWFDSKSWNAFDYIPFHEVGNILSYRSIAAPEENSALAQAIRWNTGDQITLSSSSDVRWQLTSEGQTETEVENSVNMGINGSVDFDIPFPFIPNVGVEGDYSTKTVNTRTTKVRDTKGVTVFFGNVDQSIGNTRYNVIPYVYWAKNGALVLDYAVTPELAQPGFEETWWQRRYGEKSDPAFILPWRLDREKGSDVSEAQTQQTKEIIFDPSQPEAGDVVTIKTRVHNWSLIPTPGPVEVQFFVGDPAAGGTPIVDVNGKTSIFVEQMTDRGSSVGELSWVVPAGIGFLPRIYAVIDPSNDVDEIHETNNKGWNVLNISSGPTHAESDRPDELPYAVKLHQNYPNPFNPTTTIGFDLSRPGKTTIQVLDMLGREVARIVDQELDSGSYNVRFDGSGLSSGVYMYRLVAGETVQTRRMLLLK